MSRKTRIIIIVIIFSSLVAVALWSWRSDENVDNAPAPAANNTGQNIYQDAEGRFSFTLPSGYAINPIEDALGETLLAQKNDDPKQSFQIFISPFDEEWPITPDRILQDIPDMIIKESQETIVGKDKFRALIFKSNEPAFGGDTREVWFVLDGYLYQITAPIALDAELAEMMKTWQFVQ